MCCAHLLVVCRRAQVVPMGTRRPCRAWRLRRRCALPQGRATPRPRQIVRARKGTTWRDPSTDPLSKGAAAPCTGVVSLMADHAGEQAVPEVNNKATEGGNVCY